MSAPEKFPSDAPTLHVVARLAGVSKSLASRALRGDTGVSEAKRTVIVDAADAVGYPVTEYARRRALGESVMLAALVTDLTNPFHTDVVVGAEQAARRRGASLVVLDGMRDTAWMAEQLASIDRLDVSGVLIVSTWLNDATLTRAAARRPVVVVGALSEGRPDVDTVDTDDTRGIEMIVDHLVAIGHERIAFVTESDRTSSLRRQRGYISTMDRFFGKGSATTVAIAQLESEPSRLRRLLEAGVTAAIASNDATAVRVMNTAELIGATLPGQLAVTGYDNTSFARLLRPRLTSADQPREAMGARAIEMMFERLKGRSAPRRDLLPPKLRIRESTAAQRASDA